MYKTSIYESIIDSKTGTKIPVLKNGKTIESKYNPEREAENLINQITEKFSFFIVIGIGSGITIKTLLQKYTGSKIIGIETSNEDISFISQFDTVKSLMTEINVKLISSEQIGFILQNFYLPVMDGNIRIIENRAWVNENKENYVKITGELNKALKIIGQDYSVQCHFGKIWLKNALKNLKSTTHLEQKKYNFPVEKKAVVIGAGPSLENKIYELKKNRANLFIISTDTGYKALLKYQISSDAVVSLDGQFISSTHFSRKDKNKDTVYFLDICGNSSVCKKLLKLNKNIYLFSSSNPLSIFSEDYFDVKPLVLESGSGTVTISALDLAVKSGFTQIEILGADFSYSKGKSYTKGTYLEENFAINEFKLNTIETNFDKLMFRTELKTAAHSTYTTDILESYKISLIEYLDKKNLAFEYTDNVYKISNPNPKAIEIKSQNFRYKDFLNKLQDNSVYIPLLPFMAYIKNKEINKEKNFQELCNIAHNDLLSYN